MRGSLIVVLLLVVVLAGSEAVRIHFADVSQSAGLTVSNTFGGRLKKDYILETTGNGAAIFDYDDDAIDDITSEELDQLRQYIVFGNGVIPIRKWRRPKPKIEAIVLTPSAA